MLFNYNFHLLTEDYQKDFLVSPTTAQAVNNKSEVIIF